MYEVGMFFRYDALCIAFIFVHSENHDFRSQFFCHGTAFLKKLRLDSCRASALPPYIVDKGQKKDHKDNMYNQIRGKPKCTVGAES